MVRQQIERRIGVLQAIVGLLQPRDNGQLHGLILLKLGLRLLGSHLALELELSRKRHLLRNHHAGVGLRLASQPSARQRVADAAVAQRDHRVGQAALLRWTLPRGFVPFLGRDNLRVVLDGLGGQLPQGHSRVRHLGRERERRQRQN